MTNNTNAYKYFVGIDIAKASFDVFIIGLDKSYSYPNTQVGWARFFKAQKHILSYALVVAEATGGYEAKLLKFLIHQNIDVHRANPRKVKFFIQSFGTYAKTDLLDAKALALYAQERHPQLMLLQSQKPELETLRKLVKRRQEKNRLKGPDRDLLINSIQDVLQALDKAILNIESHIKELFNQHQMLKQYRDILQSIPGIGNATSASLLAQIPELGTLSAKQVASLAGLAPHPYQSGQSNGYRRTRGGRHQVKPVLFLAALTASRSKTVLGDFYTRLIDSGKKPIVALVALMRKIIVIANAKLRDFISNPLTT